MSAIIIVGLFLLSSGHDRLPSYNGRTVAEWFEMFEASGGWSRWTSEQQQESMRAIIAGIGGDALPFLNRVARRAIRFQQSQFYADFCSKVPRALARKLPMPKPDSRVNALHLIAGIGTKRLQKDWNCRGITPDTTPNAVKTLAWALGRRELRDQACSGIIQIGPSAATALPELIKLISTDPRTALNQSSVLGAIGALQSSASNAVPALLAVVTNKNLPLQYRAFAAHALAEVGEWARSTGPAVGRLLVEESAGVKPGYGGLERAIASIGNVPEEAIPVLKKIVNDHEGGRKFWAAVALWSHDPEDEVYQRVIRQALEAPLRPEQEVVSSVWAGQVISLLSEHGTNVLMFERELEALSSSINIYRNAATHALIRLRGGTNYVQLRKE